MSIPSFRFVTRLTSQIVKRMGKSCHRDSSNAICRDPERMDNKKILDLQQMTVKLWWILLRSLWFIQRISFLFWRYQFLHGAGRDPGHGHHGMIRVFEVKAQPAFYIVRSASKADEADLVFEGFF
jgi:hypothetical protein